jgi:hypothetical protein
VALEADVDLDAHPTAADTRLVIEQYWVVDVQKPRLIRVLEPTSPEPLLQELQGEVERLLVDIPPA